MELALICASSSGDWGKKEKRGEFKEAGGWHIEKRNERKRKEEELEKQLKK